jgi:AraC-like DNA-binding protein
VALDCGYFDQSHLIRDFREFSGICPSDYRPVEPDRRNHVAVNL